jgi:hypothetical protein
MEATAFKLVKQSQWQRALSPPSWQGYTDIGQLLGRVGDRYERLVKVAAEILATSSRKHLSQVSVLDSSSSRTILSLVWATCSVRVLSVLFIVKECYVLIQVVLFLRLNVFWMSSRGAVSFLELWRHPRAKMFAHIYSRTKDWLGPP